MGSLEMFGLQVIYCSHFSPVFALPCAVFEDSASPGWGQAVIQARDTSAVIKNLSSHLNSRLKRNLFDCHCCDTNPVFSCCLCWRQAAGMGT